MNEDSKSQREFRQDITGYPAKMPSANAARECAQIVAFCVFFNMHRSLITPGAKIRVVTLKKVPW
jgi:hypothetical protein